MRIQDYEPPKLTLGVVGVVAIIIPILLGYFLVSGLGTSKAYTDAFQGGAGSSSTTTTSSSGNASVAISIPTGAGTPGGAPGYAPDTVTVVVGVNNTLVWTNNDGQVHHTVTSKTVPSGAASFNSGDMAGGATFNTTLTTPGTYTYICSYHTWMTGTVVVVAGSGTTSSSSSSTSSTSTTASSSSSSSSAIPANATLIAMPKGAGLPNGAPGYAPDNITIVIGVNNTVAFINNDTVHHTVTSGTIPQGATSFDSGDMAPGASFVYTFTVPGTYTYICIYHSWMTGTITVVKGK